MPAPYDYSNTGQVDTAAPMASGLNLGLGLAQKDFAFQQQQVQAQRVAQQRADLNTLANNPNPTARDYAAIVAKYPELKDSFKTSWDALNAEQQQQKLASATPVFHAMNNGRPDLAAQLLQQQLDAQINSKAPQQEIQATQTWLKVLKEMPNQARMMGAGFLASVMPPDKFEATFGKVGSENRDNTAAPGKVAETASVTAKNNAEAGKIGNEATTVIPLANATIADTNNKIWERGARLGLDQDRLKSETSLKAQELFQQANKLTDDGRKIINDSAGASVMANNTAVQMRGLADQFEKADPNSGAMGGSTWEALKSFTGQQDYVSQLRKEYTRIRAGQVNALLPPGPASDKDIENAQAGFLKDTAKPAEIASWLRGMAKLQDYQSQYEDARAQWVGAVGHLGKTPKDINIGGVQVPAGTSLIDYAKQVLKAPGPSTQAPQPAAKTNYMQKYGTGGTPG